MKNVTITLNYIKNLCKNNFIQNLQRHIIEIVYLHAVKNESEYHNYTYVLEKN